MNGGDKELYTGFLRPSLLINGPNMNDACLDLAWCFKMFAVGGCRDGVLGSIAGTNGAACVPNSNGIWCLKI